MFAMDRALKARRVAFIHAPNPVYAEFQNNGILFMPVWAYALASHLPDDDRIQLSLHDLRLDPLSGVAEADVFLFSGINQDHATLVEVQGVLKTRYPQARFVIGGPICWSFDQAGDLAKLSMFDHIVIGDGEDIVADLVDQLLSGLACDPIIRRKERFKVSAARPLHRPLLDQTIDRYYGAVLEVSRGCPFLCEFCDIRVLPDNNRPHNKPVGMLIEEMDYMSRRGVRHFLLACDNFIGDPRWAEEFADRLLEWQDRTGYRPSLYTWLTINLYKHPALMRKMRQAGFDMLFIGIESFNSNSLLETAKVQNVAAGLVAAIQEVQSYGFVIIGGLIFGFDSDDEACFDITLRGLAEAGLISGDPSLLTALPGTPLYRRMKLSNRLRNVRYGLGGYKYQTNIRYLIPRAQLISGFNHFVTKLTDGAVQYTRLKAFFDTLDGGNYIPLNRESYANLRGAAKTIVKSRSAMILVWRRIKIFVAKPRNVYWLLRGFALALTRPHIEDRFAYLRFWLVLWSTVMVKYQGLTEADFDIESVPEGFDRTHILPENYAETSDEQIQPSKIKAQQRYTTQALRMIESRNPAA
jgi:radical SAM superfamily enzyme YgiQ (UPF0313 family)